MSNSNPIIPPGSPLQRQQRLPDSKLLVSVFIILAVHAFVLSGLLIQGCKRQGDTVTSDFSTNEEPSYARMPVPQTPPDNAVKVPSASVMPSSPVPAPVLPPSTPRSETTTPAVAAVPPPQLPSSTRIENSTPVSPAPNLPTLSTDRPSVYVVKKGDTLTKVARMNGTTLSALRSANNLKTDRVLVGQKIKIPSADTSGASSVSGDRSPSNLGQPSTP
jgi:LysM repeat protein